MTFRESRRPRSNGSEGEIDGGIPPQAPVGADPKIGGSRRARSAPAARGRQQQAELVLHALRAGPDRCRVVLVAARKNAPASCLTTILLRPGSHPFEAIRV